MTTTLFTYFNSRELRAMAQTLGLKRGRDKVTNARTVARHIIKRSYEIEAQTTRHSVGPARSVRPRRGAIR